MAISYEETELLFTDIVRIEEAEKLLECLITTPGMKVNLGPCTHLHPANLQVLMAAKANIGYWPDDADLCAWLKSALMP